MRRLLAIALMLTMPDLAAEEIEISKEDSIFAVITHKAGLASGVAHNHLVTAADYQATLSFDDGAPLTTRFELRQASDKLMADPWEMAQAWYPRFEELGILDEAFTEVSAKDREKIRKSMLAKGQLDAAGHPEIVARITEVREQAATHGNAVAPEARERNTFPYAATLELTIRGKQVAKPVAARYELVDGALTIEALGAFNFTDFGIKPYSAFLGAVKNQDGFHVYVSLSASMPPATR